MGSHIRFSGVRS